MKKLNLSGRTALVTGASSGIGLEMARQLAHKHGSNLVVVARREERLNALRDELVGGAGVNVDVVPADLSTAEGAQTVIDAAKQARIDALILNAGITHFGPQLELSPEDFNRILAVNVSSLVHISTAVGKEMVERKAGAIMFVASMAGLQPVPYQTAYAGTKAFVVNYGRGLQYELKPDGVSVTTFCPGGVRTEMATSSGLEAAFDSDLALMSAEQCAEEALASMIERAPMRVAGLLNRTAATFLKHLPSGLVTRQMGWQYRRALKHRK